MSFAHIVINNMEPATGDVYKVKTQYKLMGAPGEFIDAGDIILEQKEISEFHVIKLLVENDLIDLDDYINLDNEYKAWKEQEE